jgi:hypothetical protein
MAIQRVFLLLQKGVLRSNGFLFARSLSRTTTSAIILPVDEKNLQLAAHGKYTNGPV